MSNSPGLRICAQCRKVLDMHTSDAGVRYLHTMQDKDDHPPEPVVPPPRWREGRCDFCNADRPSHELPVRDFVIPDFPEQTSLGSWAACDKCATWLRADNWPELEAQALRRLRQLSGGVITAKQKSFIHKLYFSIRFNVNGPLRKI